MAKVQGFLNIPQLISNIPGEISPVGELSPHASTFSRTVGYYEKSTLPTVGFTSFHSVGDDNVERVVPTVISDGILTLGAWLLNRILNEGGYANPAAMALALTNTFSTVGTDFAVGDFVNIGVYNFPSWISWNKNHDDEDFQVKTWWADEPFRTQFRNFTIIVVPPVEDVDLLWGSYAQVYALMQARTNQDFLNDVATARAGLPYSHLKEMRFNWINPLNNTQQVATPWGAIIYGDGGNNDDNIRNAIIDYILDNSSHTREEWKTVLPSLFVTTEFIITPLWNRVSIPNQSANSGLNSPIFRNGDLLAYAMAAASGYTQTHIQSVVEGSVFTYKSLAFTIFGGSENIDGVKTFHLKFSDYMPLNPQQADFSRMSTRTRTWVNKINEMLPLAETLSENTSLPPEFSLITRDGVKFVAWRFEDTLYLIAAKSTVLPV